jgi:hypothetical protein
LTDEVSARERRLNAQAMARLYRTYTHEQLRRLLYIYRETGSLKEVDGNDNKRAIKRAVNYKLL